MDLFEYVIRKKKYAVVNGLITVVLLAIILNQITWLNNMYDLFHREFKANANETVLETSLMELAERSEILGGATVYAHNFIPPNDTSRFFVKNVVTADSTYAFIIDKNDPNVMPKISQFVLKDHLPINLDRLSLLFKEKMQGLYNLDEAYFDYLDLQNDMLISTNSPDELKTSAYIRTDTVPLDIIHSIGIVGYVENPRETILDNMKKQLIFSVLLIIIGVISLFLISRSFILQWKSEKMRQDSVNAMTHEFKRPISNAVSMASVIQFYLEKKETQRVLGYVDNILIELNKLTLYTKRIQQISNNEKSSVTLSKENVDIISFFESLRERYVLPDGQKREVSINLELGTSRKIMHVDMLHFSNVMDNLVENAIKYTIAPTVVIDINVKDIATDRLKISVKDNGVGISPKDRKLIFDKFYRVRREETKSKVGFGLGLTYVKSIIEAHGGDITVDSRLNEGSEFIITLKI